MKTHYNFIYFFKYNIKNTNYYFTTDNKLFNYDTKRFSKKVVRCSSIGFNLNGKFITLKKLKSKLVKINNLSKNNFFN
jgi:hypothetical protein